MMSGRAHYDAIYEVTTSYQLSSGMFGRVGCKYCYSVSRFCERNPIVADFDLEFWLMVMGICL